MVEETQHLKQIYESIQEVVMGVHFHSSDGHDHDENLRIGALLLLEAFHVPMVAYHYLASLIAQPLAFLQDNDHKDSYHSVQSMHMLLEVAMTPMVFGKCDDRECGGEGDDYDRLLASPRSLRSEADAFAKAC